MRACKIVSWLYPVYVSADARKEFLLLWSVDGELQFAPPHPPTLPPNPLYVPYKNV